MLTSTYAIPDLPPPGELESKAVLKVAAIAHRFLAELKGRAATIPNQGDRPPPSGPGYMLVH